MAERYAPDEISGESGHFTTAIGTKEPKTLGECKPGDRVRIADKDYTLCSANVGRPRDAPVLVAPYPLKKGDGLLRVPPWEDCEFLGRYVKR